MPAFNQTVLGGVATGVDVPIPFGGTYQLVCTSTNWGTGVATLQIKDSFGTGNYISLAAPAVFSADGVCSIDLGDASVVRMLVTGTPGAAITATLKKVR